MSHEDAEDVVQEAFAGVLLRDPHPLSEVAYWWQSVRNAGNERFRKVIRRKEVSLFDTDLARATDPLDELIAADLYNFLVSQMTEREKRALDRRLAGATSGDVKERAAVFAARRRAKAALAGAL